MKKIVFLIGCFVLAFSVTAGAKTILIIESYHAEYPWDASYIAAINEVVGDAQELAVGLIPGRRVGLDRQPLEVDPYPDPEPFRDPPPKHGAGEELGAAGNCEVPGSHRRQASVSSGDVQGNLPEVRVRAVDLGENRQRIEAFSITVDAEVGMPISPCRQQTPNSGTGIVDSAKPRLRIRH